MLWLPPNGNQNGTSTLPAQAHIVQKFCFLGIHNQQKYSKYFYPLYWKPIEKVRFDGLVTVLYGRDHLNSVI